MNSLRDLVKAPLQRLAHTGIYADYETCYGQDFLQYQSLNDAQKKALKGIKEKKEKLN